MNSPIFRLIVLAVVCAAVQSAFAGPFHTKIIASTEAPVVIELAENVFLQVRNFTQEGGSARGTVLATINGETATVLTASQINTSTTTTQEFINRIVVAGPATVTINPVAGATLTITYRKVREGAPEGLPTATPIPTATPTVTPTATPTPTP